MGRRTALCGLLAGELRDTAGSASGSATVYGGRAAAFAALAVSRGAVDHLGAGGAMSLKRWNAKRDQNEVAIVRALWKAGAAVLRLDAFDMLVLYRGHLFMLDAKMPKGRPTEAQAALLACGWPLRYVRDEMSALRAIGAAGDDAEPAGLR